MKAQELFDHLKSEGIEHAQGQIHFDFLGVRTKILDRSIVGNVIQKWLEGWMRDKGIAYTLNPNTQEPPDFYLNPADPTRDLLEVKCFDGNKSANFDVGNFMAYCTQLMAKPEKLDSSYLIFAYTMDADGKIGIKDFWLKKVWEICGPSADYKIKLQVKKGAIFNIRPITWHSDRAKFKAFGSPLPFLEALDKTLKTDTNGHHLHRSGWLQNVISGYESFSGTKLR